MREIWIILRREFRERVMTRSFFIGTIAFPLLFGGLIFLPALLEGGEVRNIVVVDETGGTVGNAIAQRLGAEPEDDGDNRYIVDVVTGQAEGREAELTARMEADEIDGYLVIPADVLETNEVRYRSANVPSPTMLGDIQIATTTMLRTERLRLAGIEMATINEVIRPVQVRTARATGEAGGDAEGDLAATLIFAYLLAFLIYFMVFLYGVTVMRSVLEEKTSRIAEVLVSSVRSTSLMAGKIIGVAGAAVTQLLVWAVLIGVVVLASGTLADRFDIEPGMISSFLPPTSVLLLFVSYLLLGFFLYAALFAALGASVTSEQEAQSFQMLLMLPLILPLLFLVPLTSDPMGQAATFLGLFPLSSPVAMPMRLSAAAIPPSQIALSLALLLAGMALMAWIAGKIYRIGILATGKRPDLKELIRWVRMA